MLHKHCMSATHTEHIWLKASPLWRYLYQLPLLAHSTNYQQHICTSCLAPCACWLKKEEESCSKMEGNNGRGVLRYTVFPAHQFLWPLLSFQSLSPVRSSVYVDRRCNTQETCQPFTYWKLRSSSCCRNIKVRFMLAPPYFNSGLLSPWLDGNKQKYLHLYNH